MLAISPRARGMIMVIATSMMMMIIIISMMMVAKVVMVADDIIVGDDNPRLGETSVKPTGPKLACAKLMCQPPAIRHRQAVDIPAPMRLLLGVLVPQPRNRQASEISQKIGAGNLVARSCPVA